VFFPFFFGTDFFFLTKFLFPASLFLSLELSRRSQVPFFSEGSTLMVMVMMNDECKGC